RDPARARRDGAGQAAGRAAARHQPQDALQQAREVRHPGGEVGPADLTPPGAANTGGEGANRPLPPDLARLLHDVRGPLNSLTMHLQVLKRTVAEDELAADSLRTVQEQVARLADMLPAAFALAALEPGPLRAVDLGGVMEAAREQAGGSITLANTSWPSVRGDEPLLTL